MPKNFNQSEQKQIQYQNQQNGNNSYGYYQKINNKLKFNEIQNIKQSETSNKSFFDKIQFNALVQDKSTKKRLQSCISININEENQNFYHYIQAGEAGGDQYSVFDSKISQSAVLSQPTKRKKFDHNQSLSLVKKNIKNKQKVQICDEQVKNENNKANYNYNAVIWIQQQRIKYTFCIQVCRQWWGGKWILRGFAIQFMSKYISQNNPNYRRYQGVKSFHYDKIDKYKSIPQIIKAFRQLYKIDEQLWTIQIKEVSSEYKQYLHYKQTNYSQDNNTICIYLTQKDIELYDKAKIQQIKLDYLFKKNMKSKLVDQKFKLIPTLQYNISIKSPNNMNIVYLPQNKIQIKSTNQQQQNNNKKLNYYQTNQIHQQKIKIQQIEEQINFKQYKINTQIQQEDFDQKYQVKNKLNKVNNNQIICQLNQQDKIINLINQRQWEINVALYFNYLSKLQNTNQASQEHYKVIYQLIYGNYQNQQQEQRIDQYLKEKFDKYLLIPSIIQHIKKKYELTQQQFQQMYDQKVKQIQPLITLNKQIKIQQKEYQQQINEQKQINAKQQLDGANKQEYKVKKEYMNQNSDDMYVWDENFVQYLNKRINQYMVQIKQKRKRNLYIQNSQQCQIFKQSELQIDLQYQIDVSYLNLQKQKYRQQK